MRNFQIFLGRTVYWALLPLRRAYFSKYTRAYGVVEHDNKILVVKNWLGSGSWSLPGGGGHNGESHEDTLIREINEETGLAITKKQIKIILKGEHNREFGKKKFIVFHVAQNDKPKVLINNLEIVDHKWVDIKDLHKLDKVSYELARISEQYK